MFCIQDHKVIILYYLMYLTLCPGASLSSTRLALFPSEREATQRANTITSHRLLIFEKFQQNNIVQCSAMILPEPHPLTVLKSRDHAKLINYNYLKFAKNFMKNIS